MKGKKSSQIKLLSALFLALSISFFIFTCYYFKEKLEDADNMFVVLFWRCIFVGLTLICLYIWYEIRFSNVVVDEKGVHLKWGKLIPFSSIKKCYNEKQHLVIFDIHKREYRVFGLDNVKYIVEAINNKNVKKKKMI